MKTDYTLEVQELLQKLFTPATPETSNAVPKTLEQLHTDIINVLPAKWIYQEDVYNALKQLNFKTFYHTVEEKASMYYFVSLN